MIISAFVGAEATRTVSLSFSGVPPRLSLLRAFLIPIAQDKLPDGAAVL
jgi:hypothetical protein